jgi:uncharacterized membrane protein YbaN (DUF454 family)
MSQIKNIGMFIIGWFFVLLGILGLFLPILQGILFIMIGLTVLSSRSKMIGRLLKRLEERFPHQYEQMDVWKGKITRWFKGD